MPTEPLETPVLDADASDGVETPSTQAEEIQSKPLDVTRAAQKPSDDVLSKIKFDVDDMDDDKTSAPSEESEYVGTFKKAPKLEAVKDQEAQEKKSETEKPEKVEEKIVSAQDTAVDTKQAETETRKSEPRDYSKFPTDLQPRLKHVNNQGFAIIKELYPQIESARKEVESVKAQLVDAQKGLVRLPESYHEHPQAFIFDPKYQEIASNYDRASYEVNHWTNQLEKIELGEEFQTLRGYTKEGQPVLGEPQKPTARDKIQVQNYLSSAVGYQQAFQREAAELQKGFVGKHTEAIGRVHEAIKKFIPWETDEKLLSEKVGVGNGKLSTIKELYDNFINFVPEAFRGGIMSKAWANQMIVTQLQRNRIAELEAQLGVQKTNTEHQKAAQPGASKADGGKSTKTAQVFNTEGMDD